MAKSDTTETPTRTFYILDAAGERVGEQTLDANFSPIVQAGQSAVLKETREVKAARAEAASE